MTALLRAGGRRRLRRGGVTGSGGFVLGLVAGGVLGGLVIGKRKAEAKAPEQSEPEIFGAPEPPEDASPQERQSPPARLAPGEDDGDLDIFDTEGVEAPEVVEVPATPPSP